MFLKSDMNYNRLCLNNCCCSGSSWGIIASGFVCVNIKNPSIDTSTMVVNDLKKKFQKL